MINYFRYTDKELKTLLKSIVILIDSNEQVFEHITEWLNNKNIPHVRQNLDFGDYSFYITANPDLGIPRDIYFTDKITIERKNSLEEISSCFTSTRAQLENEFIRHKGEMILLIENAEYEDIIRHNYRTEYKPEPFLATLHSFSERYDIPFTFMKDKKCSGQFIYLTFYYWLRNFLLHK